ncbi:MAG: hypothetical protein NZ518_02615, partial [Dehalococcoidia bacterium]|nr:hypothetical protein [Dehalococcoidia bacterium]
GDGSVTMQLIRDLVAGTVTPRRFVNTLTEPAGRAFPALAAARADFRRVGAADVVLTGAGPTLFAVTADPAEADRWATALRAVGHTALVSKTDSTGVWRD